MLWTCGDIVYGIPEYCDKCWECSARCKKCGHWFNKDDVDADGICNKCPRPDNGVGEGSDET